MARMKFALSEHSIRKRRGREREREWRRKEKRE